MKNFKLKLYIKIILFLIIFLLIENLFAFLLTSSDTYTRHMLHEMYNSEENIDVAFIGASHTYRSFIPSVFDKDSEAMHFNMGSSGQSFRDSYFMLKELLRYHQPKQIIIESGFARFVTDFNSNSSLILTDYFEFSPNLISYFLNTYIVDEWPKSALPSLRYNYKIYDGNIIKELYETIDGGYFDYNKELVTYDNQWYEDRGFVYRGDGFESGNVGKLKNIGWKQEEFNLEAIGYLHKMIKLCQDREIEVILCTAPIPYGSLIQLGNYGEAHEYIKDIASQYQIEYYDFNLLKPDVLKRKDEDYYDEGHMNGNFAYKFSELFANVLMEHNTSSLDIDNYLYDSFDELNRQIDFITNTWFEAEKNGSKVKLKAYSVYGYGIVPEYRFERQINESLEYILIRDYSMEDTIELEFTENYSYKVRLSTRPLGSKQDYSQYYINEIK